MAIAHLYGCHQRLHLGFSHHVEFSTLHNNVPHHMNMYSDSVITGILPCVITGIVLELLEMAYTDDLKERVIPLICELKIRVT